MFVFLLVLVSSFLPLAAGHASIWHPSMWGFNVTAQTFPYDNRPVAPLMNYNFSQWWFHGHLDYPPHPQDVFELPAGQNVTTEIACDKGATSYFGSNPGGDIREANNPDNVCPGSPMSEYHTKGLDDLKGCALAIAYKNNVSDIQPEDFTVFSINQTCVWTRFTDFSVPVDMPPCPAGLCTCAFFWIHSQDSGGEQNYMNSFQCNITNSTSNVPLAAAKVPRRCGADPANKKPDAAPGNCTYGAKQPFYWFQTERNNMFEGTYSPPFYLDLYNFRDGAQNDIFQNSYSSMPVPSANQTVLPVLASLPGGNSSDATPATSTSASSVASTPTHTTSATPSPTLSGSPKTCKRNGSAFSRRNFDSSSQSSLHNLFGVNRHSRRLSTSKRSSLWRPI
ncbi:hypothetical protein SERLA73DRAFT_182223 [Serpula lacrymans var. lacrymans S7.3]|uniref:Lytic polysaccharide monooxygenase n=2 Tax=Serpula lacrymans var. lacrymans TaxID=341189 RepID=F8PWV9_SERL3|nr:uncharacterized protein SERLADRAFT_468766 [Serpula lacrymans var. lacrymans S7.9]EGN99286.1 hypothetical protein SERLA73DRAFT_182223 [Serpula lacrymans var. lacrymans S7.3]EGO24852.1 hypothetical protein SERLADRAFT_468766 [Serpula lacrymans var. lacrymans S7.9]